MKKLIVIALLIPMSLMLVNCGGGKPKAKMQDIPEWYLNPPQAEDVLYEAGDAVKQSMGLAKEAADARARDGVAQKQKGLYNEAKANLSFEDLEKEIQKLEAVGQ